MSPGRPEPLPVRRARGSEPAPSVESLYRSEFIAVARAVHLVVHDERLAEDVTQEAFVRLLRHWKKVSRYDRPGAWVRRVALNLAFKEERKRRLRARIGRDVTDEPTMGDHADVDLLRAIAALPTMQRAAIVLGYYEDRPAAEIGDLLGCSEATARVHLSRGRRALAALLGEEDHDGDR